MITFKQIRINLNFSSNSFGTRAYSTERTMVAMICKVLCYLFYLFNPKMVRAVTSDSPWTSDDIDMKLGPVTKLDKKKTTSKKIDDNVMLANYDVIVIFPIFGQFGAIRKSDSEAESVKLIFSLTVTFYLIETEIRTKKSLTQLSNYCFE